MQTVEPAPIAPGVRRVVVLMLVLAPCFSSAQSTTLLDSAQQLKSTSPDAAFNIAKRAYHVAVDDTTRAQALLVMGTLHTDLGRYDSALQSLEQALTLYKGLKDSARIAEVYEYRGVAWEFLTNNANALENYEAAYKLRKQLKLTREQAYSLNSIGNIQVYLYNYPKALENFLEALRLGEEVGDEQVITNAYNNIGMVYDYTDDLDKALDYYQKAREGFKKLNNLGGLGGALNNIGLIYKNKGEPAKAIPVYEEALAIFTKLKSPFGVGVLQNNLGVAYQLQGKYEESLAFHQKALRTNTQIGNQDGIANSNNSIGQVYLAVGRYRDAIASFATGLEMATKIPSKDRMAEAYEGLSTGWERLHDYKKSLDFMKEARVLRDSILSAEKFQKLYEMEQKYQSALKEQQIALLNVETENQKLTLAEQRQLISKRDLQLTLLISSVVLIALVVYLYYSRLRLIQNAKVQALTNEKEQAVIKSIYEQRLNISKDMHDEIGSGLTHIAMLSEVLAVRPNVASDVKKEIHTITDVTRTLIQSMSEIIWALNPHNETLSNLIAYLREQTNKLFESFDVEYAMTVQEGICDVKLGNIQRRNLFLVTKETLNNALKHANASRIELSICSDERQLNFEVRDNGVGFDPENVRRSANGLRNMRSRMEEISGTFEIRGTGEGTIIKYCLPLEERKLLEG